MTLKGNPLPTNHHPPPTDVIAYLDSLQASGIRPGLSRVRALLRRAGNPHRRYPSIVVAGTNGKGSVSAMLSSILIASGYRTGLYTSPHLLDLRERWMIDGAWVSETILHESILDLRRHAEETSIRPTYFEALTLLAFMIFHREACEIAILEVGMGGRLDATNVVRPLAAVVTSIALDHTEYLGTTLAQIATEKAGIIHPGCVALTSNDASEVLEPIEARAGKAGVPLHVVGPECIADQVELRAEGLRFNLETPLEKYAIESPLTGSHQVSNIALAVRTAEEVAPRFPAITAARIIEGVRATKWRGRFERAQIEGKQFFIDGAHNPAAARALAPMIERFVGRPRTLLFGIMEDKDIDAVVEILFPLFDRVVLTIPYPPRSASLERLTEIGTRFDAPIVASSDPFDAFTLALGDDSSAVVVTGSLYLAGAALQFIDERSERMSEAERTTNESSRANPTS